MSVERRVVVFRVVALSLLAAVVLWEAVGLLVLKGHRDNYTDILREARYDRVAGPALILVWTWLTMHLFFNPRWKGGATGWRDLAIYIPLGVLLVLVASKLGAGFGGYRR